MIEVCRREIERLHVFFQEWFEATVPDDEATFARVAEALAEDFELVSTDGSRRDRETILASIRDGYGDHAGEGKEYRIEIHDVHPRFVVDDWALLTYEEWQISDGSENRRLSSAWFRRAEEAPCGVQWVHLHETAMPESESV